MFTYGGLPELGQVLITYSRIVTYPLNKALLINVLANLHYLMKATFEMNRINVFKMSIIINGSLLAKIEKEYSSHATGIKIIG